MSSLSRRALLATVAGSAAGLAGCGALTDDARPDEPDLPPLYAADGVSLPADADPITVADPTGGAVALVPADPADLGTACAALDGATPVVVVGRDAQATLAELCAADGRPYGLAGTGWGPDRRVAGVVPHRDGLATHLFDGYEPPDALPGVVDRLLNPPAPGCSVDVEGLGGEGVRTVGVSHVHGHNGVARLDRRDAVGLVPGPDRAGLVVDLRGTIHAGGAVGGDDRYVADRVRLVVSFDDRLRAVAPPATTTEGLTVRRDVDRAAGAVDHAFVATADATRRRFTACGRSLVTAPTTPDPFSYVANARFRWRDPRLLRPDDRWHHHTPGRALWRPGGG